MFEAWASEWTSGPWDECLGLRCRSEPLVELWAPYTGLDSNVSYFTLLTFKYELCVVITISN